MKRLLSLAICATFSLTHSFSQVQDNPTLYVFDEMIGEDIMIADGFTNVSPNGQYAVGIDETFMGTGFVWEAATKQISLVYSIEESEKSALVKDVTNDGVLIGAFQNEEGVYSPGYRKDGEWHALPLPENIREDGRKDDTYCPVAVAVSADGKIIGGNIYYKVGEKGGRFRPVLWIDGELQEFPEIVTVERANFYLYDISNDGRILCGYTETENGEWEPAIIVDGEMKILYTPRSNPDEEDRFFITGIANHINANGDVTGTIEDEDAATRGFIYNETDGMKFIDGMVACSLNSKYIFGSDGYAGNATIYIDGEEQNLAKYIGLESSKSISTITGCSEGGKVLIGSSVKGNEMGMYAVPSLILNPKGIGDLSSVNRQNFDKVTVSLTSGGHLFITGAYTQVEIYNTTGSCVIKNNQQGQVIDMSQQATGIYIIKVMTNGELQTFKVAKQ